MLLLFTTYEKSFTEKKKKETEKLSYFYTDSSAAIKL